jgi:hypothetical protein
VWIGYDLHAVLLVFAGVEGQAGGDPIDRSSRVPARTTNALAEAAVTAVARSGARAASRPTASVMNRYTVLTPTSNPAASCE